MEIIIKIRIEFVLTYFRFDVCEGGGDTLGYWKYTCHDGLPYKDTFSDENCEGKATSNSLDDSLSANCSGLSTVYFPSYLWLTSRDCIGHFEITELPHRTQ